MSQVNPVYIIEYFTQIHFNIIFTLYMSEFSAVSSKVHVYDKAQSLKTWSGNRKELDSM